MMKLIGYLLANLSVAGLLGIAVATHAADKTTAEKATTEKSTAANIAADVLDCDGADRRGHRHGKYNHKRQGDRIADGGSGREDGFAGESGFGRDGGPSRGGRAPLEKILGLSDVQQKALDAAREKEHAAAGELREKVIAAQNAIFKAADSNASDEELNKLAANSASLRAQLELGRIKIHRQLVALLTPEQKQKLTEWEAEHKPGRGRI